MPQRLFIVEPQCVSDKPLRSISAVPVTGTVAATRNANVLPHTLGKVVCLDISARLLKLSAGSRVSLARADAPASLRAQEYRRVARPARETAYPALRKVLRVFFPGVLPRLRRNADSIEPDRVRR